MSTKETRDKLAELYMNKQEKYVYYILALTIACIGFTITQILNLKFHCSVFLVLIALVFLALSFVCGIKYLNLFIHTIQTNVIYLDFDIPSSPHFIKNSTDIVNENLKELVNTTSRKTERLYKWQIIFFYLGIFCFVFWVFVKIIFLN